jgi:Flp pilus assembly protein TadD
MGNDNHQPALAAPDQLALLELLEAQRPQLAAAYSQRWLANAAATSAPQLAETFRPVAQLAEQLAHLANSILDAEAHRLAQPGGEPQPLVSAAVEEVRSLHASLLIHWFTANGSGTASNAALLAQAGQGSDPLARPAIDSPLALDQRVALVIALTNAGRDDEAAQWLPATSAASHPGLVFAGALLAFHTGKVTQAQQAAGQLVEMLEQLHAGSADPQSLNWPTDKSTAQSLIRLLLDLQMARPAVQASEWALKAYPNDIKLLRLLAQASQLENQNAKACQALQNAVCLEPGNCFLRQQLAESLEQAGDWEAACAERATILDQEPDRPENLHALANCALHAGKPTYTLELCGRAIQLNPEDGQAYALLGAAHADLKDRQQAQAAYLQAVQLLLAWRSRLALAPATKDGLLQTAIQTG